MGGAARDPRVLIVGTGAMACLLAARLARNHAQVVMLGSWRQGLAALRRKGVHVVGEGFHRVEATDDPAACAGIPRALVLVKAWQTGAAAERLRRCLPADGKALTLQNGLGNRETLAEALGEHRVAVGVATLGAALAGPGRVVPGGAGEVALGPGTEAFEPLLEGLAVRRAPDLDGLLWGKLVVNASLNPVAALAGVRNGEILGRPALRRRLRQAAREVAAVARALGIDLPCQDPAQAAEEVAGRTAANRCSMLNDLDRGAPTEVDAINGEVVRAGSRAGVATPLNLALWGEVLQRVDAPGWRTG